MCVPCGLIETIKNKNNIKNNEFCTKIQTMQPLPYLPVRFISYFILYFADDVYFSLRTREMDYVENAANSNYNTIYRHGLLKQPREFPMNNSARYQIDRINEHNEVVKCSCGSICDIIWTTISICIYICFFYSVELYSWSILFFNFIIFCRKVNIFSLTVSFQNQNSQSWSDKMWISMFS